MTASDTRSPARAASGPAAPVPPGAPGLAGARVVVVGAARSGLALTRFLLGAGANVTLTDNRPGADLGPEPEVLAASGARLQLGGHQEETRSEEHTSELQSLRHLVCRLLLEKKK